MKYRTRIVLVALLMALLPLRHFGQTPYRQYADEGIILNFFEIGNPDFRLYLLYNLEHDGRFSLQAEEENGQFVVNPSEDYSGTSFFDTFEMFYNNTFADFRLIDKVDLFDLVPQWKERVTALYFTSITLDIAMTRAMNENNHCVDSNPFCTSDLIQFQAANSSQTADQLEGVPFDDGCIGSSYNPSWYHMRINTSGQFVIHMEGRDPTTSAERDIDFCIWGPYDDPTSPCVAQLTGNKIIDCCYSSSYSEDIYLGYPAGEHHHNTSHGTINEHDPVTGEYYILMITNFSREPCVITFTKAENSGPGTTDCGILPGIATNGGPYCVGDDISLTVTTQAGATYSWTGPNGFLSNQQNPVIPNCTYEMGGTYTCVTTVDNQTTSGSTVVIIYPEPVANFTATTVCTGNATQFTSTSTTAPAGHELDHYEWDFGDGATSEEQNPTHTYAEAGTYTVIHRVTTGGGQCHDETTGTARVIAMPHPTVTADPSSVEYGGTATLTVDPGAPGNFTYHWEPANMVTNPNSQTTQTVIIQETVVYTVTVTNTEGDCSSTVEVTVTMAGSNLTATASADQYELCDGESTTIHAHPLNGTGNYTYSWSPGNTLSGTTIQNPVATPPVGTTTYSCRVSDGLTEQNVSVSITVHPEESYEFTVPEGENCDSYYWDPQGHTIVSTDHEGNVYDVSDTYERVYANRYGCDSTVTMHVHFEYTPNPTEIYPMDPANIYPHWVIPATEFQINSYDFEFWDNNAVCVWDSVSWTFENPNIAWLLEPDSTTAPVSKKCRIYVTDYHPDTIWLKATIFNNCAEQGKSERYWFVCSYFGIEDSPSTSLGTFTVTPNPNNGEMQLNFERLTGKVNIKVYDMTGSLVDSFETYNADGSGSMTYQMQGRARGIYYFVVTAKEGTITQKVVIQ